MACSNPPMTPWSPISLLRTYLPGRRAGNHPQRLHKWHRGLPVLCRSDAYPALLRHLSVSADTSMAGLVPERVMVRAVGHWSNTNSL